MKGSAVRIRSSALLGSPAQAGLSRFSAAALGRRIAPGVGSGSCFAQPSRADAGRVSPMLGARATQRCARQRRSFWSPHTGERMPVRSLGKTVSAVMDRAGNRDPRTRCVTPSLRVCPRSSPQPPTPSPATWATPTSPLDTPAPASGTVERHSRSRRPNRAPQRRFPAAQPCAPANWSLAEVTQIHNFVSFIGRQLPLAPLQDNGKWKARRCRTIQ